MSTNRVYVIAEAGVNHNGSFENALRLIDIASSAGADAVKFQTAIPELVMTRFAGKAAYQKSTTGEAESQLDMCRKIHLPLSDYVKLQAYCSRSNIDFLSTPFDHPSIQLLDHLGLKTFKIPSGEITNLPYLRAIGKLKKRVILSTGMCCLGDVEVALNILEAAGTSRSQIWVLHATTEYPCPFEEVNLQAMLTMRQAFGVVIGYSDHTVGIEVPIAAVALGARIIEKHFTIDKNMEGPDHKASLDPSELKSMIQAIRNVEKSLGSGIKTPTISEISNIPIVRRSLVAARPIQAGSKIVAEDLIAKRPATGISPMLIDSIIGSVAKKDYQPDDLI